RNMFSTKAAKLASRGYASVASPSVASTANGIKVAAVAGASGASPLASVSLVINGGSRFESSDFSGAAHFLKGFGFRNTQGRTSFRTVREAELNGATLTASATRENITYTVQCFKEAVPYFVEVLADIATKSKFAEHEFREVARLVAFESLSARHNAETRVLDGLHQAAFRGGLGNSLYALESSPVASGDKVRQYAQSVVVPGRIAVVGTGVDAQELAALVAESPLGSLAASGPAGPQAAAAQAVGGVQQVYESAAPVSHYALGFTTKDAASVQPLAALLNASSRVKWSSSGGSTSLAHLAASSGFGIAPFAFGYSDAGLVGVVVSAPRSLIKNAVQLVAEGIQKNVALADEQAIGRAVAKAAVDAAEAEGTAAGQIEALAKHALGQGMGKALAVGELKSAAESVFSSKPVAASLGLPQDTAYVDTLGF
ncbi:ubiquinol-cytochrome c reductase core subunit 1, partial [Coemansia erecta]